MKQLLPVFSIFIALNSFSQSFSLDEQWGTQAATEIAQTVGIYQDTNLTKYVSAVGQRLVSKLGEQPFQYRFHVLDMAEPNAFALPGGYVYVSRGILALTNSEDELAGILGHEIIHVHRRHSVEQVRKSWLPGLIQLPGLFVGAVVDEQLGAIMNAPAAVGSGLLMGKYSRAHESESDEMGAALAAKAGYNPQSLAAILGNLHEEVEALTGEEESFSYFDSHPYTPNRVSTLEALIAKGKIEVPNDHSPFLTVSEYKQLLNGLPIEANPANGLIVDKVFYHPHLDVSFNLGKGWVWNNVPVAFQAAKEDGTLSFIVRALGDSLSPDEVGREKRKELFDRHGLKPIQASKVELDEQDGYLLIYEETLQGQPVKGYAFWWQTPVGVLLEFTGIATEKSAGEVWKSITSVGTISDSAYASITYPVLSFVESEEGETLGQIVGRSKDNLLGMSMLSALNGRPFAHAYKQGDLVKVGVPKKIEPQGAITEQ